MPFFSIIIPTYNREKFILKAIGSVLNQSFTDFELIIIDDNSQDSTENIVQNIHDSRLVYIKNSENKERCISRNIGIQRAVGQYICFLDSDDYHLPNHLEYLYNEIVKRNFPIGLFFTNAYNLDGDTLSERECPEISDISIFDYIARYTFNPQRMCIHKEICAAITFDPAVYVCEDLDFAARIALKYPVFHIPVRTTVYVFHSDSFTGGDSLKSFKELENYKRIFTKPELASKFSSKVTRRLYSMCYFHISGYYEMHQQLWKMYKAIFKSFFLYPAGYNGKTNKILLVRFLYNLPVLGKIFNAKKSN